MPQLTRLSPSLANALRRCRQDRRGLALLEFAFTLPLVLAIGGWGIELSNLALCNLRVSQYALNLADHASRVGQDVSGGATNLREVDINDVLQGAKLAGASIDLTGRGRITISSLENVKQSYDTARVKRIHWQRCLGAATEPEYGSHYDKTTITAGSDNTAGNAGLTVSDGMGDAGAKVDAPNDSGVMFVEVNYLYKPLFGSLYLGSSPRIIHYIASFIVRDNRSFTQIYNLSPTAVAATCDKYTA